MFQVDLSDMHRMEQILEGIAKHAVPIATQRTLNDAAFTTMRKARARVGKSMILRNKWTERSIQVERAKGLRLDAMAAVVGSRQAYMEDQEFGGTKRKKSKQGIPIPTTFASNEPEGATVRRRLPRGAKRLEKIKLDSDKPVAHVGRGGRRKARSKKQQVYLKMKRAVETKKRFIYLGSSRQRGIYKVVGGRVGKRGVSLGGAKLKMVFDLSEKSVRIPRNAWLWPTTQEVIKAMPEMYREQLRQQLKRLGMT